MNSVNIVIIGAGVAGLTCACELVDRGATVTVYEKSGALGGSACSWYAGGMLAPWCERESAEKVVMDMGQRALSWWSSHVEGVVSHGSLVLSMQRDVSEIRRFARLTENHQLLTGDQIGGLEPDLSGRFEQGLFFSSEAHLDPRLALRQLVSYLATRGVEVQFGQTRKPQDCDADRIVDCRGYAARDNLSRMRGVKGEMLVLKSKELTLSRPVRLLHPRYPVYIVPREGGLFMLGATMIENDERHRISALSMLELLSAAYALHPEFGEAEIVEIGVDVRPAFDDNLPRLQRHENILYVNGLYRHGFLLGPSMAIQAADAVLDEQNFMDLDQCA